MLPATLTLTLEANGQTFSVRVPTLATGPEDLAQAVNVAAAGLLADPTAAEAIAGRGLVHVRTKVDRARRHLLNHPTCEIHLGTVEMLEGDLDAASIVYAHARGVLSDAELETGLAAIDKRRRS